MQTQLLTAGMLAQGLSHPSLLVAGNSLLQKEGNGERMSKLLKGAKVRQTQKSSQAVILNQA